MMYNGETDVREALLAAVEDGALDAYDTLLAFVRWLSVDEVREVLHDNELDWIYEDESEEDEEDDSKS